MFICNLIRLLLSLLLLSAPMHAWALSLKIATLAPEGTTWMKEMRAGADEIDHKTEGRVKVKFYPGGVMGNDKSVLRKIRAGQLQGGAFSSGGLAEIYPDAQIYSLPFLFRSYEEIDYVRQRMDPLIRAGLEKQGFIALGISEGGFAYVMSKASIQRIADLSGHKVWIPEGDTISQAMFKAAGVAPIPLPIADVYTGLQTGLVDTVANTTTGAIAFQWHTKMGYMTDAPLLLLMGMLVVDKTAFDKIGAEDQKIVQEIFTKIFDRLDMLNRTDNAQAKLALVTQGIKFTAPSDAELASWREIARKALAELGRQGAYTPATLKILEGHLATYRQSPKEADAN